MENVENEMETAGLCAVGMRFLKEVSDGRQLCLSLFVLGYSPDSPIFPRPSGRVVRRMELRASSTSFFQTGASEQWWELQPQGTRKKDAWTL